MGIEFVHVVTEKEQKQGATVLGWMVAIFLGAITVSLAVIYWKVALVVLGGLALVVAVAAIRS